MLSGNVGISNNELSEKDSALEIAREYFLSAPLAESGIPVAILLVPKSHAGLLNNKKFNKGKDSWRAGLKKVQQLPGNEDYMLMHLSNTKAFNCSFNLDNVIEKLSKFNAEYFPGIRVYDPFLSPPIVFSPSEPARFTFAELFAGIGGFRLGLEALHGRCVFASEIDKNAASTYEANFGSSELYGDITDFYASQLPAFDILTAGFPCQSFSERGERKGLNDPRGQLYRELIRVLNVCQPKAFLFENVVNLVRIDGGRRNRRCEPVSSTVLGRTFTMMLEEFSKCGYKVSWNIVNSCHWLPQTRERVFIIGFRSDLEIETIDWRLGRGDYLGKGTYSQPPGLHKTVREILEPKDSPNIPPCILSETQYERVVRGEAARQSERRIPAAGLGKEHCIVIDGKAPTLTSGYRNVANFVTKYVCEESDGTVRDLPRFLTHRECCRLMGFPETFVIPVISSSEGASLYDNIFYKQIGNAVCPPVVTAIGEQMQLLLFKHGESGGKK